MGERDLTRRRYLLTAAASGVMGLSGCAGGGEDGSEQTANADTATGAGTEEAVQDEATERTATERSGDGSDGLTPWTSRYGDPRKTRSTPDSAPADLESRRTYELPRGFPVVTDSGAFALGTSVGRVNPSTGEAVFGRSAPVGRGLFVQNGIVVCGELGGGDRVAGLDAETGERVWLVEPGGTVVPFPAGDGVGYAGSHIGVLDPASGDTRWDRDRSLLLPDQPVPGYSFRNVAVHPESDTAFAYTGRGESEGIEAYDLTDGEQRWKNDGSSYANSQPAPAAVRGDTVYVTRLTSDGKQILALDRASGSEQWRVTDLSLWQRGYLNGFAVDGERVYVGSGGTSGATLLAYDPADGTEQWSTAVPGEGVLVATGDALVRVGGRIEVYSKSDGELQRSAGVGERVTPNIQSGVAVAGGRLYLPTAGFGGLEVYGTG